MMHYSMSPTILNKPAVQINLLFFIQLYFLFTKLRQLKTEEKLTGTTIQITSNQKHNYSQTDRQTDRLSA